MAFFDGFYLASQISGYLSWALFIIVFSPQLYENWKRKSADSLSVWFIILWILADTMSLAGVLLIPDYRIVQIAMHIYFLFMDLILLSQFIYYTRLEAKERRLSIARRTGPALLSGSSSELPDTVRALLGVALLFTVRASAANTSNFTTSTGNVFLSLDETTDIPGMASLILGYASAFIYMTSRIPQMIKNWKSKTCDGLSIYMFIFTVMGNITYALQIIFYAYSMKCPSSSKEYIVVQLPYLAGSAFSLFADFFVFGQFWIYRNNRRHVYVEVAQTEVANRDERVDEDLEHSQA